MRIKDTKLGKWLKAKAPKVLDLVGDALPEKGLLGVVKNIIDKDENLPPDVKADLEQKWMDFELECMEFVYADIANSREMNARVQESANSSWLAKNIGYIIDFVIISSFLGSIVLIVYRVVPESNKELFYTAFGSLGTFAATSINWHRGSSQGSAEKQRFIDRMLKR